jgi:anti-sigma regulatory factor (Ser/Thr protein kinase)
MEMITHTTVAVHEQSQTFSARQTARELAERVGFGETDAHRVGLVATEMATNLVKHSDRGGDVLIGISTEPVSVELIALDRGPGIRDLSAALRDGHSSAGTPGTGLGAIRRLSDDFDVVSSAGRGTVVLSRLRARRAARNKNGAFEVGVVSVAVQGEMVCGDAWRVRQYAEGASLLVADGLGHGALAHEAAEAAARAFEREPPGGETSRIIEAIHRAIRHTRGAAAAIADVRLDRGVVRFSGVGNVAGVVDLAGNARHAVSSNGTLGHQAASFREFQYPWERGAILIMHSDGLSARWTLDHYPGIRYRDASLIAALLFRDFSRSHDDATVLVAREAA